jgi:prephenate dehydrogenase
MSDKYKIGIIGYGDFSGLMIEYLSPYADIVVSSRSKSEGDAGFGARFAPLEEVLSQPIIIPSIPSQHFESFFETHRGIINPSAVVIDVCSVKVRPLEVLERLLPSTCQIIGTHPMFGPASVRRNGGITGLKCVVCPVQASDELVESVRTLLGATLGLTLIDRTPDQHDKEMAYVQGLSHYIGRLMDTMDIPDTELSTIAYQDLLDMKKVQGGDSWELFRSIMTDNPYAKEINQQLKSATVELDTKIWK